MQANTDLQHTLLSHSMPHLARVQRDVRMPSEPTPATPTPFQDPPPMVHAFPTAPEPVQPAKAGPIAATLDALAEVIATLQAGLEALRTNPKSSEPCPPKLDTAKKKAEQSNASSAVTQSSARKRTSTPSPGKASAM